MPIPIRPQNDKVKYYKAYINNYGIVEYVVKLLDGNLKTIYRDKPYITSDLKEAQNLARAYRHVTVIDATVEEVKTYMYHPENLPMICKDMTGRGDIIERFKWSPSDEKYIVNILLRRGYNIDKAEIHDKVETKEVGRGIVSKKEMKLMIETLEAMGYNVSKKEEPVKEAVPEPVPEPVVEPEMIPTPELDTVPDAVVDYSLTSIKELRALAKERKINSFGLNREKLIEKITEYDSN